MASFASADGATSHFQPVSRGSLLGMPDEVGPPSRGAGGAVAGVLLATVVLLGLATWAASIGTDDVVGDGPGAGASLSRPTDANTATGPRDEVRHGDTPPPASGRSAWTVLLARVLIGVAAALLAVYLVRRAVTLARWLRGRRGRLPRDEPVEPDPATESLVQAARAAQAIVSDVRDQRALLDSGTPRNAIVACWHRFEVQAADGGVPRRRHETSSEFTLRLLDLVDADLDPVATLAGLYREARFSDHDLDESDREAARAALDALHGGLASRWARSRA